MADPCAQRLLASSKESRSGAQHAQCCRRCAQRLLASSKESPGVDRVLIGVVKCSTPVGVIERITLAPRYHCHKTTVLNACWRHRKNHGRTAVPGTAHWQCSTPVGVIERITTNVSAGKAAFRSCSTPVGVIERITGGCSVINRISPQCSTPVGVIERITLRCLLRHMDSPDVLNACWRHRKNHWSRFSFTIASFHCAQRLLASSKESPDCDGLQRI